MITLYYEMRTINTNEPSSLFASDFSFLLGGYVVGCYGAAGSGDRVFYDGVVNLRKVLNIRSVINSFPRTCNIIHFQQQSLLKLKAVLFKHRRRPSSKSFHGIFTFGWISCHLLLIADTAASFGKFVKRYTTSKEARTELLGMFTFLSFSTSSKLLITLDYETNVFWHSVTERGRKIVSGTTHIGDNGSNRVTHFVNHR